MNQNDLGTVFSLIKYEGLLYGINRLSLTDQFWKQLKQFNFINEAFSSPFNSRLFCVPEDMRFCSIYDKSDLQKNYVGDFFKIDFTQYSGNWIIFPPTVEKIVIKTLEFVGEKYNKNEFNATAIIIVPKWDHLDLINIFKENIPHELIAKNSIDLLMHDGRKIKKNDVDDEFSRN